MKKPDLTQLDWKKMEGLLPAVVQNADTGKVLMLGYMNQEAVDKTITTGSVTFYSRSKQRLWTKGESSGNTLSLVDIVPDCDNDSLLVLATPQGPTCHRGNITCYESPTILPYEILFQLEKIINQRKNERPKNSYTTDLFNRGITRIAQKVGEEATETVIAAIAENQEAFSNEVSDLLFHLLVLICSREVSLDSVLTILTDRHKISMNNNHH